MKTIFNRPWRSAVSLATLALSLALPAHAATFTLNASAEALVTTGPTANPSANKYDRAGALSVAAAKPGSPSLLAAGVALLFGATRRPKGQE